MEKVKATMTVLFEEPFWIGIYEREDEEKAIRQQKYFLVQSQRDWKCRNICCNMCISFLLALVRKVRSLTSRPVRIPNACSGKSASRQEKGEQEPVPSKPYRHSGKNEKFKSASSERKTSWQRKKNGFYRNNRRNAKNIVDTKRRNAS